MTGENTTGIREGAQLLDHYQVVRELGRGGMGVVYLARDLDWEGRYVAIKVIKELYGDDPRFEAQFRREAEALLNLRHDGVVNFTDYTKDKKLGRYCLVMEYVEGTPLAAVLRRGRLEPAAIEALRDRLLAALSECHGKNVVHRDIAPDNVLLPDGDPARAKLIDFGIAGQIEAERAAAGEESGRPLKAAYASPEQLDDGASLTDRSDIYSLGLVLLACAEDPENPVNVTPTSLFELRRLRQSLPEIPPGIGEDLARDLRDMLQPEPTARPSADQLMARRGSARSGVAPQQRSTPSAQTESAPASPGLEGSRRQGPGPRLAEAAPARRPPPSAGPRSGKTGQGGGGAGRASPSRKVGTHGGSGAKPATGSAGRRALGLSGGALGLGAVAVLGAAYFLTQPSAPPVGPTRIQPTPPTSTATPAPSPSPAQTPPPKQAPVQVPTRGPRLPAPQVEVSADTWSKAVTLTWPSVSPNFSGLYEVRRKGLIGDKQLAAVRTNRFQDQDVEYGKEYTYRVIARLGGQRAESSPVKAKVPVPAYPVTALEATRGARYARKVKLSWQGRGDPRAVTEFVVFRQVDGGREKRLATVPRTPAFIDRDVGYGKRYQYRVAARLVDGSLGGRSPTASVTLERPHFSVAEVKTAAPLGETERAALFTWNGADDPKAVDAFLVVRRDETGDEVRIKVPRHAVATGDGFSYLDDTVAFGRRYTYRAIPLLVDGTRADASEAAAFILPAPTVQVSAPQVRALLSDPKRVALKWSAAGDVALVTGYALFRQRDDGPERRLAQPEGPEYVDKDLAYGHRYRYRVAARLEDGSVTEPGPAGEYATPPVAVEGLKAEPTAKGVSLSWSWSGNAVRFAVYRMDTDFIPLPEDRVAETEGTEWLDTQPPACKKVYYQVRALDGQGRPGALGRSVAMRVHQRLAPPEGVQCQVLGNQAFLDWQPVRSCDFKTYRIERRDGGQWRTLTDTDRTWRSVDLRPGEKTTLRLSAVNQAGEAGPGAELVVTDGACRPR